MLQTTSAAEYHDFLARKLKPPQLSGIDVPLEEINAKLYDFQRVLVRWALRKGRCAFFWDCGLGKSGAQLEWANRLYQHGVIDRALILASLVVAEQTAREAEKFGIAAPVRVCKSQEDVKEGINITNYERLHLFDASQFQAVVLDESSILKSYMGATRRELQRLFEATPYKLCCTATPAPNDLLELGNHAEFLGVMPSSEMLARWFINNSMKAGDYHLKAHAEKDFWRWVASWAVCVSKPSDIGFNDEGFDLPPLEFIPHYVHADVPPPPGMLFDIGKVNATTMHHVKRHTAEARAEEVAKLVNESDEPWIVWCDTNYEADELGPRIPDAVEVRGSDSLTRKEERLKAFISGGARVLLSKPDICGHGLNLQFCANVAFVGLNYSFERFYQAVRRNWRHGQTRPVKVHLIQTDSDDSITQTLWRKEDAYYAMQTSMASAMKEVQMEELYGRRELRPAPEPTFKRGDDWVLWHGDCVEVSKQLPDNSMDFSIFSPPFSSLYIYSDSMADMGNSADDDEFFAHFEYLIPELLRVTVPGRLCAVHCKDLPMYKGRDGSAGLKDFPGQIIQSFERHGWQYHSRVTIWKDPVTEMQRTKNHGLLHKILCQDSASSRQGMADYLIVFRKWVDGLKEFPRPVHGPSNQVRFPREEAYVGEDRPQAAKSDRDYSIQVWQRYASPVWWDINQMRVLNYQAARDEKDERHICPLQLDVIDRAIHLWTNPGDVVFDPFSGVGSTGHEALLLGRKFVGIELKDSYFQVAVRNLERAVVQVTQERLL